MLRHNIKIAFRYFNKDRSSFFINVTGLTIGLAVSLLILSWVQYERSIDKFHENGEQLYKVFANMQMGDGTIETWDNLPFPITSFLEENFPEVEKTTAYDPTNKKQFKVGEKEFLIDGIYATTSLFDMFSFPFLEKMEEGFFNKPNAILLSQSTTEKLFGENWKGKCIGKTLDIDGKEDFFIAGIYADPPKNSSLEFDFVLNLEDLRKADPVNFAWGNFDSKVIVQLKENADFKKFKEKIASVLNDNNEHSKANTIIAHSFQDQYLNSKFENGELVGGRIEYVRLFTICAFFLLLIAIINFMNLATARASLRAKEVGVRKTIGANRSVLVKQFMIEAGIVTFVSFFLAIFLAHFLLPFFQEITGKEIAFDFSQPSFWMLTIGLGLTTAILAGSYPSFFLSSFKIHNVLKGETISNLSGNSFRKSLVIFQFTLSILLVVGAMMVTNQVDFLKNINLGLNKENVMYFRTPPGAKDDFKTFENELLQITGVTNITSTNTNPLNVGERTDNPTWEGMPAGYKMIFNVITTDNKFLNTMKVSLIEGNNFSSNPTNLTTNFILNETAVRAMNLENPIGKTMEFWEAKGTIVGVVKDFHIHSLHSSIEPLILTDMPRNSRLTMLRINPEKTESIISAVGTTFQKFAEGKPYRYDFLDERYWQMYRSENRMGAMSRWFAIVALLVSCLGLFGLSAFISEQKKKEISIRKVLGASIENVIFLLSKKFLKLIVISLLIALPLAWYFMNNWLMDFAYRIEMHWSYFAIASILAIGVTFLTISFHSINAALTNPVNNLKE